MSGGRLLLVATPIGNLGDLTLRARDVLAEASVVACEDTRRCRKLYAALDLPTPQRLIVCNRDNEERAAQAVVEVLARGTDVVLVTDAGTPGVADPGETVVRAAVAAGAPVEALPGASSVLVALAVSGLPTGRFCFESFLPRTPGERRRRLADLAGEPRTMLFCEAPPRVAATLAAMGEAFGVDRRVAVCRELTKLHEEVFRGTLGEACAHYADGARGEVVIVVDGARVRRGEVGDDEVRAVVANLLTAGRSVRDAAAEASAALGVARKRAYQTALDLAARRSAEGADGDAGGDG